MISNSDLILAKALALKETCQELVEANIFTEELAQEYFTRLTREPDFFADLEDYRYNPNCATLVRKYWHNLFADSDYVSITNIARESNPKNPSYVVQSWLRSKNTVQFLRVWEKENNPLFDESACEKLIERANSPSFTLTLKQWIANTASIGLVSKQGKNGGTLAHPDIAMDFHMWANPEMRMNIIEVVRNLGGKPTNV